MKNFFKRKWKLSAVVCAIALVLALSSPIGVQINSPPTSTSSPTFELGQHQVTLTIGTEVYAAGVADYTCDGTDDNVQFQAALNALPAGGGKLFVLAGNYQWTPGATVSRAVDSVTIEGVGKATYFAGNNSTALFSAGSQSNWVFRDFSTDVGGITISSATNWLFNNIWIGTTYYGSSGLFASTSTATYIVGVNTATDDVPDSTGYWVKKGSTGEIVRSTTDANAEDDIQAAIDACNIGDVYGGEGTVYLSKGTFSISATIYLRSRISLRGSGGYFDANLQGRGTVLKLANNANCDVIREYGYPDAQFFLDMRDIAIDGNKANNISGDGIAIGSVAQGGPCAYLNFVNITIVNCVGIGFNFYTPNKTTLTNPNVLGCGSYGINCFGGEGYVLINACVQSCGFVTSVPAIHFLGRESTIMTTYLEGNYNGFYMRGKESIILGLVTSANNTDYAFKEETDGQENIILGIRTQPGENIITGGVSSIYGSYNQPLTLAGTNTTFLGGTGYVTKNSGTATILSGSTTIQVTHGLATTPTGVQITPTANTTNPISFWWIDTLTSGNFTINVNTNPGASGATFDWRAVIGEGN